MFYVLKRTYYLNPHIIIQLYKYYISTQCDYIIINFYIIIHLYLVEVASAGIKFEIDISCN